jgi:SAM-dependent methyltransferase
LTIAGKLDGGKVFITDLAEDMLSIARENAARRKIMNIETVACDVCELPFDNDSFDMISCRFGFMFFPDMDLAAKEMWRVLKPGGKMSTAVWNVPEKNFWITVMMSTIQKYVEVPAPPPGAPGMFRCAKPGLMKEIFEKAGFKNITETEVPTVMPVHSAERYWDCTTEVAAPVVAALSKADEATTEKIRNEVYSRISEKYPGDVALEASALVFTAEK